MLDTPCTIMATFINAAGTAIVKYDVNNKPSENLSDPKITTALQFVQKMLNDFIVIRL